MVMTNIMMIGGDKMNLYESLKNFFNEENQRVDEKLDVLQTNGSNRPEGGIRVDDEIPFLSDTAIGEAFNLISKIKGLSRNRKDLIEAYNSMELDAIIGGAIELIISEATQVSDTTDMCYWVESTNESFEKEMNEFLKDVFKINSQADLIAYSIYKYGEVFIRTHNNNEDANKLYQVGDYFEIIKDVEKVSDLSMYGQTIAYQYDLPQEEQSSTLYNETEFIHVYNDRNDHDYVSVNLNENGKMTTRDVTVVHGTSFLEKARQAWVLLDLLDTMVLATRVNNAQVIRLNQVEVGMASPTETRKMLGEVKRSFSQQQMQMNQAYKDGGKSATISNIYVPTRDGKGQVTVETLNTDFDIRDIADLEYYTDKLFASLGIPKAFLGQDSGNPMGLGQTSMTRQDIRYARLVKRVKNLVAEAIEGIIKFKLSKSKYNKDYLNGKLEFKVDYVEVCTAEREEHMNELSNAVNVATSLKDFLSESEYVNYQDFERYLLEEVLHLEKIDKFYSNKKLPDDKTLQGHNIDSANKHMMASQPPMHDKEEEDVEEE